MAAMPEKAWLDTAAPVNSGPPGMVLDGPTGVFVAVGPLGLVPLLGQLGTEPDGELPPLPLPLPLPPVPVGPGG